MHSLMYHSYTNHHHRYRDCIENPSNSSHHGQSTEKSSSTKPTSSGPDSKTANPPTKARPSASSRKPTRKYSKIPIRIPTVFRTCPVDRCLWGIRRRRLRFVFRMGIIPRMLLLFCLILIWRWARRRLGRILMGLFWWILQRRIWNRLHVRVVGYRVVG